MLTDGALLNEFLDSRTQPLPSEQLLDAVVCGGGARVSAHSAVVECANQFSLYHGISANPNAPFVLDDTLMQLKPIFIRTMDCQLS
jgi:hypothetical protein